MDSSQLTGESGVDYSVHLDGRGTPLSKDPQGNDRLPSVGRNLADHLPEPQTTQPMGCACAHADQVEGAVRHVLTGAGERGDLVISEHLQQGITRRRRAGGRARRR